MLLLLYTVIIMITNYLDKENIITIMLHSLILSLRLGKLRRVIKKYFEVMLKPYLSLL